MTSKMVVVVEDEKDLRELLEHHLRKSGYRVASADTGESGLRLVRERLPHLILLDVMLPGAGGLDVCRRLKRDPRTSQVPVVMVSARHDDADVVAGLELGAEDYIAKPFSIRVLLARVARVLRRYDVEDTPPPTVITLGALQVDLARHVATVNSERLDLTPLELKILAVLARNPGRVFTRYQVVESTQGMGVGVTDRSVDVHIVALRRKMGASGRLIETVRGVGYRFSESHPATAAANNH